MKNMITGMRVELDHSEVETVQTGDRGYYKLCVHVCSTILSKWLEIPHRVALTAYKSEDNLYYVIVLLACFYLYSCLLVLLSSGSHNPLKGAGKGELLHFRLHLLCHSWDVGEVTLGQQVSVVDFPHKLRPIRLWEREKYIVEAVGF